MQSSLSTVMNILSPLALINNTCSCSLQASQVLLHTVKPCITFSTSSNATICSSMFAQNGFACSTEMETGKYDSYAEKRLYRKSTYTVSQCLCQKKNLNVYCFMPAICYRPDVTRAEWMGSNGLDARQVIAESIELC